MTELLYLKDKNKESFDVLRRKINVVCIGDSITGYNNKEEFSGVNILPTYPRFLQELTQLRIADCGIAGAFSSEGIEHVKIALGLFPNSRYFIIGYGTNDLGNSLRQEPTSNRVIDCLGLIVNSVIESSKKPLLLNVPYINKQAISEKLYMLTREQRDYHNQRLYKFCASRNIPLADICSVLGDGHFVDAIHPNKQGARVIAREVNRLIK